MTLASVSESPSSLLPVHRPGVPAPTPGHGVQGMGRRPSSSGHRLAVTGVCKHRHCGSLCTSVNCSSVFWELPGSEEARRSEETEDIVLERLAFLCIQAGRGSLSLSCGSLVLLSTPTQPLGFPAQDRPQKKAFIHVCSGSYSSIPSHLPSLSPCSSSQSTETAHLHPTAVVPQQTLPSWQAIRCGYKNIPRY